MSGLAYENNGPITLTTGEALEADRLVKMSSTTAIYADAGDEPIGSNLLAAASGAQTSIRTINAPGITKVTGSKAISAGSAIYPAADGKVSDAAGGGRQIGALLTAITGDGGKGSAILNCFAGDLYRSDMATIRFVEDFLAGCTEDGHKFSETADKADWLKVSVDTDSDAGDLCIIQDDAPGGILLIKCNNNALDSEQIQLNGESFKLASGKPLWFRTKLAVEDADKITLFVGLAITDTTIIAGVTDRVGFAIDVAGADGSIDYLVEQDNTESNSDSGSDITDGTLATFSTKAVTLSFFWDGVSAVQFFVDDVLVGTKTDNGTTIVIPDDEALSPAICLQNSEAATQSIWIDYVEIIAAR